MPFTSMAMMWFSMRFRCRSPASPLLNLYRRRNARSPAPTRVPVPQAASMRSISASSGALRSENLAAPSVASISATSGLV